MIKSELFSHVVIGYIGFAGERFSEKYIEQQINYRNVLKYWDT